MLQTYPLTHKQWPPLSPDVMETSI